MRTSTWLKFGTHIGGLNANTSIKFADERSRRYKRFYIQNKVELLSCLQGKPLRGTS